MRHEPRSFTLACGLAIALVGCTTPTSPPGGSGSTGRAGSSTGAAANSGGSSAGSASAGGSSGGAASAGSTSGGSGSASAGGSSGGSSSGGASCAACAADTDCGAGNYCLEGVCLPQGAAGASCTAADWCLSGVCTTYKCVGGGSSSSGGSTGGSGCSPACSTGKYCLSGVCTTKQLNGSSCSDPQACLGYCAGLGGSSGGGDGGPDAGYDLAAFLQTMGDPAPLFDGGTTTFGGTTITTTFDGGTRYVTVSLGGAGGILTPLQNLVYWNGDDSYVTGTGTFNQGQPGLVDWEYTSVYDAGSQTVTSTITQDLNDDGTFDTQDVWVVDISQPFNYQKSETYSQYLNADGGLAAGDAGSWQQEWAFSGPAVAYDEVQPGGRSKLSPLFSWLPPSILSKLALGACDGQAGFPTSLPPPNGPFLGPTLAVPGTFIKIIIDPTVPGFCTPAQAGELQNGFVLALQASAACYPGINPKNAGAVKRAAQTQPLFVACANSCPNYRVSTDLPYDPEGFSLGNYTVGSNGYQRMNVNPSTALGQKHSYYWLEEILIHELLHYAGEDHQGGVNGNPEGHDMVYGCGRYCTGCAAASCGVNAPATCTVATTPPGDPWQAPPTPAQWAFDCTDCAYPSGNFQIACGDGLYLATDVNTCSCGPGTNTTGTCATLSHENCFANQALSAGRDENLEGLSQPQTGPCTGCNTPADSCCPMEGDGVNWPNGCSGATGYDTNPCRDWPVGWCGGPNLP